MEQDTDPLLFKEAGQSADSGRDTLHSMRRSPQLAAKPVNEGYDNLFGDEGISALYYPRPSLRIVERARDLLNSLYSNCGAGVAKRLARGCRHATAGAAVQDDSKQTAGLLLSEPVTALKKPEGGG